MPKINYTVLIICLVLIEIDANSFLLTMSIGGMGAE
jgi:hypothetical protein